MKKQSYDIDPAAVAPQAPPTEEELAAAKETVKQERKQSRLAKASFAWTIISMLYAIVSGAVLISGKWILAPYSYIMAGLLGVYVVIFVVLVVSFAGDAKAGKKKIKTFKKLFGMFKIFTNIVFLIATAISMVGVVDGRGTGLLEWIVLGANMLVAAIQLTLKIWLFVLGIIAKRIGKKYTVKVQTYVNGVVKEHKTKSAVMSKLYGTEVTQDGEHNTEEDAPREEEKEEPKTERFKMEKDKMRAIAARAAEKISEKAGAAAEKIKSKSSSDEE